MNKRYLLLFSLLFSCAKPEPTSDAELDVHVECAHTNRIHNLQMENNRLKRQAVGYHEQAVTLTLLEIIKADFYVALGKNRYYIPAQEKVVKCSEYNEWDEKVYVSCKEEK